jgi:hypothetical protein
MVADPLLSISPTLTDIAALHQLYVGLVSTENASIEGAEQFMYCC